MRRDHRGEVAQDEARQVDELVQVEEAKVERRVEDLQHLQNTETPYLTT